MNSEQYIYSKLKTLGKRLYLSNLRYVAMLESVQSGLLTFHIFREKLQPNVRKIRNATERFLAQLHPSNCRSIKSFAQYLNSAAHKLFRICFLTKLFAVRFPYKHSKFETDMSIYPECNVWSHLFAYRGLIFGQDVQKSKLPLEKSLNFYQS